MASVGGILAPVGFARSILSAIFNQSTRSIVWETTPQTDASGNPTPSDPSGNPAASTVTNVLGGYVPIAEEQTDSLTITEHPVEQGAEITDHAYKMPAQLVIRIGWSAASPANNPVQGSVLGNLSLPTLAGFWAPDDSSARLNALYNTLLSVQANRNLLTVTTARRLYTNMLLKTVSIVTDDKTANVLLVTCTLQEIILVSTQVVSIPVNTANNSDPQSLTPTSDKGAQNVTYPQLPPSAVPPT